METAAEIYTHITLPALGLGAMALLLAALLPSAAMLGFTMGRSVRKRAISEGREIDTAAGEASLGAILALLGLLLAFSFGSALSLLDARKADVIQEANAIGTAFLRADYLPEPGRSELKSALHSYALTRIVPGAASLNSESAVRTFLEETLRAQSRLWPITIEATAPPVAPPIASFVAASVNDVLDAHQVRLRSLSVPVAELSYAIVLATALAALFMLGNRAGISGRPLTWRTFVLAALLLTVMLTVVDMQRAAQGVIQVDQTALAAAIFEMEAGLP